MNNVEKEHGEKEVSVKQKKTMEMVQGVLTGLQRKINHQEHQQSVEKQQTEMDDAYNHARHLERVKEDLKRKRELKKTQTLNRKVMAQNKLQTQDDLDRKLLRKVGMAPRTQNELAGLQEQLPLGGNLYFELNRIAYQRDIERRRQRIQDQYEYTLNKSPLKNHAIAVDHDRQEKLQQLEDLVVQKQMRSNVPI